MKRNAKAANAVATRPVFDFLPIFVYYCGCIRRLGGRWFQFALTAATVEIPSFSVRTL
jgi:hypothetical protein